MIARVVFAVLASASIAAAEDGPPFETVAIDSPGRTVAAELADFDGDGRADLMRVVYTGVPPRNERVVHVHFADAGGTIAREPSRSVRLTGGEALYDLLGSSPARLLLLGRDGVSVVSVADRVVARREVRSPAPPTVAAAADHRSLERTPLVWPDGRGGHWLALAGFGEVAVVRTDGETVARIPVEARAEYVARAPGEPVYTESDAQLVFDTPRLVAGDVDGDGRTDLVVATRREVRVHLQTGVGAFAVEADRVVSLPAVSEDEHYREAAVVRSDFADADGDGRVDLLVSVFRGVATDGRVETSLHVNRGGTWNLDRPDARFEVDGHFGGDGWIDIDGDARLELVRVIFPVGLLEMVEALLTREIDATVHVHRSGDGGRVEREPWASVKLGIPFSLRTREAVGFAPTLAHDIDGDGHRDLLSPGDGRRLEVRRGGAGSGFETIDVRVPVDTRGRLRAGDTDGDGLPELILYDPTRADSPVLLLRNRMPARGPSLRSDDRTPAREQQETRP